MTWEVREIASSPLLEYNLDRIVIRFDGSVVEVFGMGESTRYHVDFLGTARIADRPNRKGRYDLEIRHRQGGGLQTTVDEPHRSAAVQLVAALRRAGVPAGG